jgi:hypothetical protein
MILEGYTYDAGFHCPRHTLEHFDTGPNSSLDEVRDSEGNEIRALYDIDEWMTPGTDGEDIYEHPTCEECNDEGIA